ncbi:uncharacterized protein LOC125726655 [Brienomyrus brachyistius]|uniref:uncharacterized protein LOC125726655 n=1 Tax=Brienomyrus brachyistius TaxID=42636 RepID=UPI0020B40F27|nr:uncharacterized protein LOC125726655 [Brienomyrus brachyistius]XP_048858958.1 uncharacterized protein LOC125726655 [Brienomyrus brachyistius]
MGCRLSGLREDDGNGMKVRDPSRTSQSDSLHMRGSCEQPITLQIEGWRGRYHQHHSWPTSDCSTQAENTWQAFRCLGISAGSTPQMRAYADRRCCSHVTQPQDHYAANQYLPSIPLTLDNLVRLEHKEAEFSSCVPKRRHCLIGCCNANMEEPGSFLSQTEDEDPALEKPVGYLPLLHELDSGLGCTDGSFHQGELSAAETEEGVEEPVSSLPGRTSHGSSPSSESLISSELSDSGFYSVSTGEFRRFQKLLEKRIRLYRARMISRDQREGAKACWDLESIPEALGCPSKSNWSPEASPAYTVHQCTKGPSLVQYRKASSPHLRRYSSSAGSVFSAHAGLSHCSSPSCQRRISLPRQNASAEHLWRGHAVQQPLPRPMKQRRASHPTSPNYHAAALHHCRWLSTGYRERPELAPAAQVGWGNRPRQQDSASDHQGFIHSEHCSNVDYSLGMQDGMFHKWSPGNESETEMLQQHHHTLEHLQKTKETWHSGSRKGTMESLTPASRKVLAGNPRVLRNQLLKARASQLADERSEVTTDEEARGEVRAGRYWSKTERRQHLISAREQRQRRTARAGPTGGGAAGCSTVLELSQRKLSRLRNRKLLDDWTTVEELLTHGNRVGSSEEILCPSPLLSVTTV